MKIKDRLGKIYIIQHGNETLYKIGFTRSDLLERLLALQIGNPIAIQVIAYVETDAILHLERQVHTMISEYHARGAWFDIPNHVLDQVIEIFGFNRILIKAEDKSTSKHSKVNTFKTSTSTIQYLWGIAVLKRRWYTGNKSNEHRNVKTLNAYIAATVERLMASSNENKTAT